MDNPLTPERQEDLVQAAAVVADTWGIENPKTVVFPVVDIETAKIKYKRRTEGEDSEGNPIVLPEKDMALEMLDIDVVKENFDIRRAQLNIWRLDAKEKIDASFAAQTIALEEDEVAHEALRPEIEALKAAKTL